MPDDLDEPLSPPEARALVRAILATGTYAYSEHAEAEMAKDGLSRVDCANVLRGGVVEPGEFLHGSWRYRVRTARITVVVAFRSRTRFRVVTAWRTAP